MIETIPDSFDGERVDRVVATITGMARSSVADAVKSGAVRLDGKPVKTRSQPVVAGQELTFEQLDETERVPKPQRQVEFDVVYEDDQIIVVDKPVGVVVHPGAGRTDGTLVNGLLARYPDLAAAMPGQPQRPGIVHRLDAGTTGLLVVARTQNAYEHLVENLKARTIERRYTALVWKCVEPPTGVIDAPIGRAERNRTRMAVTAQGREARTSYEVTRTCDDPEVTLLSAKLETGRTHQIRVHFSAIGHPLVGDRAYDGVRDKVSLKRPFLHARSLAFAHPSTGERVEFHSSLPADLETVLSQLNFDRSIS